MNKDISALAVAISDKSKPKVIMFVGYDIAIACSRLVVKCSVGACNFIRLFAQGPFIISQKMSDSKIISSWS